MWKVLVLASVLALSACSGSSSTRPAADEPAPAGGSSLQALPAGLAAAIEARVASGAVPQLGVLDDEERTRLAAVYTPDARPLWLEAAGRPTGQAQDLLRLLTESAAEGMAPRDYAAAELNERARALIEANARAGADELAGFDVALSAAALRYFAHLHVGQVDPAALRLRLHVPAEGHDFAAALRSAVSSGRLLETAAELAPPLVQYRLLRDALARYRALAADGVVPAAPIFSATLRPGDTADPAVLHALAGRLAALGDLPPDVTTTVGSSYDGPLVEGVKRFQVRHGLDPDGVMGRSTQAAIAVPVSWRVRQIELALERLRWLPDLANQRVIALNIPMFHLWAFDEARPEGRPVFGMRAIVGRAIRAETPVFVEDLREVIFRPYWNVPRSILLGEILPALASDATYLERQNMEIVRGAGDSAPVVPADGTNLALLRQGELRLRQRPGPHNALGLVKFVLPNTDNVYLHSTPAQELFSRSRRDFSHGCVRVEDPVSLAEWVLEDQPGWSRERIVAATEGTQPTSVRVARPVTVVLYYLTAAVMPEDGTVRFAEDIYGHDAALDRALAAR